MIRKKVLIPQANDLEMLRRSVEDAINSINTLPKLTKFYGNVDAQNFRLYNLGRPAARRDAVTVEFLEEALRKVEATMTRKFMRPNLQLAYGFNDAEFEVVPGGFVIKQVDMLKAFNFDTNIFGKSVNFTLLNDSIGNEHIKPASITTLELTTQEINIGYSGNQMPVRLRIWDTTGSPVAWIGDDSQNHGGDTNYVGAWFKRILVGGDGTIANAKFFADANGNAVMKSVFVYDNTGTVGWIGSSGSYRGGWFKELYIGGSGPANAQFFADSNGNTVMRSVLVYDNTGTVGWIGSSGQYLGGWFKELYIGGSGPANAPLYTDSYGNVVINNALITMNGDTFTVQINPYGGISLVSSSQNPIYGNTVATLNAYGFRVLDLTQTFPFTEITKRGIYVISNDQIGPSNLVGAFIDAFGGNGAGRIYISEGINGNVTVFMRGDVAAIEFRSAGSYTPTSGYGAIRNQGGNMYWYDSITWTKVALEDHGQTWSASQYFLNDIVVYGTTETVSLTLRGGLSPGNPQYTDTAILYYYMSGSTRQLRFKYHDGSVWQDKEVVLL